MTHRAWLVGVLAILLVASPAFGQSRLNYEQWKVDVPFSFYVGDQIYPSGNYVVSFPMAKIVLLSKDTGQALAFHMFNVKEAEKNVVPEKCKLVYWKYANGRSFLRELWPEGYMMGMELVKSKTERESVTSTVSMGLRPVTVTVAASLRTR